ncbi:MAG: hypothetical protein V4568_00800 [Pseudomonadota bacterium]
MDNESQDEIPALNSDKKEKKGWHAPLLQLMDMQTTESGCACGLEACVGFISS